MPTYIHFVGGEKSLTVDLEPEDVAEELGADEGAYMTPLKVGEQTVYVNRTSVAYLAAPTTYGGPLLEAL